MNKILSISLIIFWLSGCKKETENGVYIRIQNSSNAMFSNISVANVSYGNISAQSISNYKLMMHPIYSAMCVAAVKDSSFNIGYGICGTPPLPPALQAGKYTFIIKSSSSTYHHYDIQMKRD